MSAQFSDGFKEQAVQKAFSRGTVSLEKLAHELNVGYSTLQKWIREYKKVEKPASKNRRPQDWTAEERLQAIVETSTLDADQRSQYCREKGLFPHHLDEWRSGFIQANPKNVSVNNSELKALKQEIALLQKEIRRKDKALAETAALLVLQKKFQALLEEKE